MTAAPTRACLIFSVLALISFLFILSCSKDPDALFAAVTENQGDAAVEGDSTQIGQPIKDGESMENDDGSSEMGEIEQRTTTFYPMHDAYIQNGLGFNKTFVNVEKDSYSSYIMFDLSQIDSIGGKIISANFGFIVNQEGGDGKLEVFKGITSEWTEENLSESSAPEVGVKLGTIREQFAEGERVRIDLVANEMLPEFSTLILGLSEGSTLAFASKENETTPGSELIVSYDAPVSADEITNDGAQYGDTTGEGEETDGEDTAEGEEEEDNGEDQNSEEENTEEDASDGENNEEEENTEEEDSTDQDTSNAAPVAAIIATPSSGTVPLAVSFTGEDSTDDDGITGYTWDFNDGNSASGVDTEHTFSTAGTYEVTLTVTDAEGLENRESVAVQVNPLSNEAPSASASATPLSGTVPLAVSFTGSNSTDDKRLVGYSWDFDDGTSAPDADPSHTYATAGVYDVVLSVTDEEGESDTDTVQIIVNEPENEAPFAVATADVLAGEAPLHVNFTGIASTDDKGIASYSWDFGGDTSSASNTAHTFNDPGVYTIGLTVADEEGLTSTATLTVDVAVPYVDTTPIACSQQGNTADQHGEKIWCWENIVFPEYSETKGALFSNRELSIDSECHEQQVTKVGNRIRFQLDPTGPEVGSWCSKDFNVRAELRTAPWDVRNPLGTEEWFGWSYTFGNDYKIDLYNQWKFFQVHPGVSGAHPQIGLEVIHDNQFIGHSAGEIYVATAGSATNYSPTGVTPLAGQTIDIVVHVIWGDASNGLLQVWIDGQKVYDQQVSTILPSYPWGGNAKWGIYKWPWSNGNAVQQSKQQGADQMETFMGTLRMITRKPGDPEYGKDAFTRVSPN